MNRTINVLLVEDSEDDALLLLRELRRGNYQPVHRRVMNREAMEEAMAAGEWDVIIADYSMDEFGALPALDLVKEKGLDLPFIMVSGMVSEEIAVEAMKAGAHDFLSKNRLARLVPAIQREMREAEVRRAQRQSEEQLRLQKAILESQSEAAIDGILVVSQEGSWVSSNSRFHEMWEIPSKLDKNRSIPRLIQLLREQIEHPSEFAFKIEQLNYPHDQTSWDEIHLKDGRTVECYSASIRSNEKLYYGRVWYFRDITERQRAKETIRLLSTPVLPIRNQLLILPVIGVIDLDRVRQLGEQLMSSVREQRAKVVVLDITGVPYIESEPLNCLVEIVKSTQLMGANLIMTGMSTEISKGLVEKGNLLGEIRCLGDLQSGIEEAERMLGYQVTYNGPAGPRKGRETITSSLRSKENRAKTGSPVPLRK